MSFKLQQIPSESKFCQHLRVQILEQCYPRELVSDLLTSCHAWEQRERKLTQLVIVYYIMALSLFRKSQCDGGLCPPESRLALAVAR
jgi:Insertion element 4 transposase N-terminal